MTATLIIEPTITKSKLMLCAEKMKGIPVLGGITVLLAWRFAHVDAVYGKFRARAYWHEHSSCTISFCGHSHTFESF